SWLDAGTAQGILNRFMTWKNPQLVVIGPWTHGARQDANPFAPADRPVDPPTPVQENEWACFLHQHLNGNPNGVDERAIIYYTMGEEKWKKTATWPIAGTKPERLYLDAGQTLATARPAKAGTDIYKVDFDVTTGLHSRWSTQAASGDIVYD